MIEYWERSFHKPTLQETLLAVINIPQGGLVVYGSLIAGGTALVVFVFKYKLNGLALADLVATGVVLGMASGTSVASSTVAVTAVRATIAGLCNFPPARRRSKNRCRAA